MNMVTVAGLLGCKEPVELRNTSGSSMPERSREAGRITIYGSYHRIDRWSAAVLLEHPSTSAGAKPCVEEGIFSYDADDSYPTLPHE